MVPERKLRIRRRARWFLPVLLLFGITAGALWWSFGDRQPALIQGRLAEQLSAQSPRWQGVAWQKCDPRRGEYQVSLIYAGDHERYAFEAVHLGDGAPTIVCVDPRLGGRAWLARAAFIEGERESFRYTGHKEAEKEMLERLATDLEEALSRATR
jgi:hypothetical protein